MPRQPGFKNKYKVNGDITTIYWKNRKGEIYEILIDSEDLEKIKALNYSVTCIYMKNSESYYALVNKYTRLPDNSREQKLIYLNRYIINCTSENEEVDHINHISLDNRKCNLRITTVSENSRHRGRINKNNTSGYRNVTWDKEMKKWKVQLYLDGKNIIFGYFNDVDEAGKVAKEVREKHYGKFKGVG